MISVDSTAAEAFPSQLLNVFVVGVTCEMSAASSISYFKPG